MLELWKLLTVVLLSSFATFVVMWLTVGAKAASQIDLKAAILEVKGEQLAQVTLINARIDRLADLVQRTTQSVDRLVGYTQAKEERE